MLSNSDLDRYNSAAETADVVLHRHLCEDDDGDGGGGGGGRVGLREWLAAASEGFDAHLRLLSS